LSLIDGLLHNPAMKEEKIVGLVNTFETRNNDVFICTYPKSGTTWMQQITLLLLNKGDPGEKTYSEVIPWLEAITAGGLLQEREAKGWETLDQVKANPDRRFFKTHANLATLPAGTAPGAKVVYVARNPKDVCVSLFHHAKNKPEFGFDGGFPEMLHLFAEGRVETNSWFDHVLDWWKAAEADPDHVLFLCYEDVLKNKKECIAKLAAFMGIECNEEILEKVCKASSIESMKHDSKVNAMVGLNHIRKGGAGGWRDVFTVRESETFDALYSERMAGSSLKMDFGEGLVM
ncbi:unnamed protein product, partial [Discosporangium mesarthrocarpum]